MDQPQTPLPAEVPLSGTGQTPPIYDQSPPNAKKPLLIIGLILLSLIIITGAIYAGIKIGEKKNQAQTSSTNNNLISPTRIQNIPTVVPTTDPTTGWKTYTNTISGFEFRYPPYLVSSSPVWVDDKAESTQSVTTIKFTYVGPTQFASGRTETELFDGLIVRFMIFKSKQDLKTFVLDQREKTIKGLQDFNDAKISELLSTRVAGKSGWEFTSTGGLGDSKNIFLGLKDDILGIKLTYSGSKENTQEYLKIFDQILSTFKFL